MDVSRSTEIRVGIVSVISIALLVIGIMLGKGISFSPTQKSVAIRLATSGGIDAGSPVVVNGVRRGTVTQVSNDNGGVLVTATLDDVSDLKSDAQALVSILEITGGKKIELTPGSAATALNPSAEIPGRVAADIGTLVGVLGDASGDITGLIKRLDTISMSVSDLLRDGSVVANIKTMTNDGALALTDLRVFMENNRGPLTTTVQDLKALTSELRESVHRNEPGVTRIIARTETVVKSLEGTLAKADGAITNVDTLTTRVSTMVNDLRTNKSLLHALMYDDKLFGKLDSTLISLRKVLKDFGRDGVNVNVGLGHRK